MLPDTTSTSDLPIACDPHAVSPEQQQYWVSEIVPKLYKAVQEIQELPNGWAWRFPSDPAVLLLIAEDLNMERLCCPFVHYTLEIPSNRGHFWLRMTGAEGVKAFLRMAMETTNYFDPQVAKAIGLDLSGRMAVDTIERTLEATDKLNERYAQSVHSQDS